MFEDYDGFIDLGNILFDTYHYSYDPDHLADFYAQDFVEMEGNGVAAMCWIQYKGKKYLFKPMGDAYWWSLYHNCEFQPFRGGSTISEGSEVANTDFIVEMMLDIAVGPKVRRVVPDIDSMNLEQRVKILKKLVLILMGIILNDKFGFIDTYSYE